MGTNGIEWYVVSPYVILLLEEYEFSSGWLIPFNQYLVTYNGLDEIDITHTQAQANECASERANDIVFGGMIPKGR